MNPISLTKKSGLCSLTLTSLFIATPGYSIDYVSSPPLKTVVKSAVTSCGDPDTVPLPYISWGGDIATILANGNQKGTKTGSHFNQAGLKFNLVREDIFSKQVDSYLACQSPYLRGTMGMINLAAPVTEADPRTKMKIVHQMTWSVGGDAMVVKGSIKSPKDLKGKSIAVQAYGPHVDYLAKVLADAGLSLTDVKIRWTKDLTGTDQSPMAAFQSAEIDAAMVIIPDALALTSAGTVGTGAEQSVKGARILMTTKTASRIIADVYAVRQDYYEKNKAKVQSFVQSLLKAQEELVAIMKDKNSKNYKDTMQAAAELLLDSPQAVADAEGMYADAQFAGLPGNQKFLADAGNPRNFESLNSEIQASFLAMGLIAEKHSLGKAVWDFKSLAPGLKEASKAEAPRFDTEQVAKVVAQKQRQDTLAKDSLFSFEVFFKPNQNDFSESLYKDSFDRVVKLAATYGGALITIEGHSDPMGFLRKKKAGETGVVLSQIKQSAKNLSLARANSVRDAVMEYARKKGVSVDPSQFAIVGHGIDKPRSGMCGEDPCSPKTEQDWLNNMRVEFRIIQVEAEESVFVPL